MYFVDGDAARSLPPDDRGLNYGDGLFETLAVNAGAALALQQHVDRLVADAARLGIGHPPAGQLRDEIEQAARTLDRGVIKLLVTRGSGGRGYRPADPGVSRRVLSTHPWPADLETRGKDEWDGFICRHPVSQNPALAGIKHLNRLDQVLASREWPDERCFEGLMCDPAGNLVEGTRSNLVLVRKNRLLTPELTSGGVAGIVRAAILELAPLLGLESEVATVPAARLADSDEVLVCNSVIGVRALRQVRGIQHAPLKVHTAERLRPGIARSRGGRLKRGRALARDCVPARTVCRGTGWLVGEDGNVTHHATAHCNHRVRPVDRTKRQQRGPDCPSAGSAWLDPALAAGLPGTRGWKVSRRACRPAPTKCFPKRPR